MFQRDKQIIMWSPLNWYTDVMRCVYLEVNAPGHHQRGQKQVRHSQRNNEIVGGGLQSTLPWHRQTHQHITKHHTEDQKHQKHGIEVVARSGVWWRAGAVGECQWGSRGGERWRRIWRVIGGKNRQIPLKGGEREGGRGHLIRLVERGHDLTPVVMVRLKEKDTENKRQEIVKVKVKK